MAQKPTTKCATMAGIERAPYFSLPLPSLAAAAICSRFLIFSCGAQIFDLQQRASCLDGTTNGLPSVLLRSWRCVRRAHMVAYVGSLHAAACQQHGCARTRLYVRMRAVPTGTVAQSISCMSLVDGTVIFSARGGAYMSHLLTFTAPKQKLSVWVSDQTFKPSPSF